MKKVLISFSAVAMISAVVWTQYGNINNSEEIVERSPLPQIRITQPLDNTLTDTISRDKSNLSVLSENQLLEQEIEIEKEQFFSQQDKMVKAPIQTKKTIYTALDDKEVITYKNQYNKSEQDIKKLIKDYHANLQNIEKRKDIEKLLLVQSDEFKNASLKLAKDKLKELNNKNM